MLAVQASSPYTGPVVWVCLCGGLVFLAVGLYAALKWDVPAAKAASAAADAAKKAADNVAKNSEQGKVDAQAQGALKDTVSAVSELAKNLKDLTVATRLLVIGVLLVLVAAVGAGFDAVGDAAGDDASAATSTAS